MKIKMYVIVQKNKNLKHITIQIVKNIIFSFLIFVIIQEKCSKSLIINEIMSDSR